MFIRINKAPNSLDLADVYDNIGITYCHQHKYCEALYNYIKCSLILLCKDANSLKLANVYFDIGIIYYNQTKYFEALEYYNKVW